MGLIVVIIVLIVVIVGGVLWGRNTVQKDIMRKQHDEDELDRLHRLRG